MHILLIEDDKRIAQNIKKILEFHHFSVKTAENGEDGRFIAETEDFDLIILDYLLPKISGLTLLECIRKNNIDTPVLMLTAKSQLEDKLESFKKGADDYLTKPFSKEELIARVKALCRRISDKIISNIVIIDDLQVNLNTCSVTRGGHKIGLSPKEYAILEYLIKNEGKVVNRVNIMNHVWGDDVDLFSNTVDVHIRYLRTKIDDGFKTKLLKTVKGKGYMICRN